MMKRKIFSIETMQT